MTGPPLRVAIAHEHAETRSTLHAAVVESGHSVQTHARDGAELKEQIGRNRPDLVIVQESLPDISGLEAVRQTWGQGAIPMVVILDRHNGRLMDLPDASSVLAVLQEPVRSADLIPLIPLAIRRFAELRDLRQRADQLLCELDNLPDDSSFD